MALQDPNHTYSIHPALSYFKADYPCNGSEQIYLGMSVQLISNTSVNVTVLGYRGIVIHEFGLTVLVVCLTAFENPIYRYTGSMSTSGNDTATYTNYLTDNNLVPSNGLYMLNCTTHMSNMRWGDSANNPVWGTMLLNPENSYYMDKSNFPFSVYSFLCFYQCAEGWFLKNDAPYECYTCNYTTTIGDFTNDSTS